MKCSALLAAVGATAAFGQKLSHADANARLEAAGVFLWSSSVCTEPVSGCTSYEGINLATVDGTILLKNSCGCNVVVTGGSEAGHATGEYSHGNGYKMDFQKNAGLDGYITSSFARIADRGDGYAQWQAGSGNIYCDEGNHWDVTYYTCGC